MCSGGMVQEEGQLFTEQTGIWVVKPEEDCHGKRLTNVIDLDTVRGPLICDLIMI